ncbi:MAG: hypothetical protein ACLFQS_09425 [Bacteroidales bacterium]
MKKFLILTLFLTTFLFPSFQQNKFKKADDSFAKQHYAEAVVQYQELIRKNPNNTYLFAQLAHSLRLINDYTGAEIWYERAINSGAVDESVYYYYAHTLLFNQMFNEGMEQMKKYYRINPQDQRAERQIEQERFLRRMLIRPRNIFVDYLEINSKEYDFAPSFWGTEKVIFASAREADKGSNLRNTRDGTPMFKLYQIDINGNNLENIQSFSPRINASVHTGPACISADGNHLYFTRNISEDPLNDEEEINKLSIFSAFWDGENWTDIKRVPINNKNNAYSVGQPALSPDGNTLYFVSDMSDGYGETDIYRIQKRNGSWGRPENLGPTINTPGREMSPYIHSDGYLYFSSDGHPTMGGLDLFSAKPSGNNFETPRNLGTPINSSSDDISIIFKPNGYSGFLASNRRNGRFDDLYSFFLTRITPADTTAIRGIDPEDPAFWRDYDSLFEEMDFK